MKMLAKPKTAIVLKMLMAIPPKKRKLPRSANSAEQLSETKTTAVPIKAVTMTCGSTEITKSSNGPIELPVKKPNPISIARRV